MSISVKLTCASGYVCTVSAQSVQQAKATFLGKSWKSSKGVEKVTRVTPL